MLLIVSVLFPRRQAQHIYRSLGRRLTLGEFTELARRLNTLRYGGGADVVGTPFEIVVRSNAIGAEEESDALKRIEEVIEVFGEEFAAAGTIH